MQPTTETDIMLPARADGTAPGADPPLLQSEEKPEFARMLAAFSRDVEPRGAMEEMYVSDIACIVWEMLRLRRYITALINTEFRYAVGRLAEQMMDYSGERSRRNGANAC